MRRASLADAPLVNTWVRRDFGDGADFSEFLSNSLNVCLVSGNGGALFAWRGPGIYEVHCFFEQRGREVLDISRSMLRAMFALFGAKLIWAAIPNTSRKVCLYVRWLGFKFLGEIDQPHGSCQLYQIEEPPCLP